MQRADTRGDIRPGSYIPSRSLVSIIIFDPPPSTLFFFFTELDFRLNDPQQRRF
jgi:hypothetical protein